MDFTKILLPKTRILIKVKPNASRTRITAYSSENDTFSVDVRAPPVDGKANTEIERYFSKLLKKTIVIIRGKRGKRKILEVS